MTRARPRMLMTSTSSSGSSIACPAPLEETTGPRPGRPSRSDQPGHDLRLEYQRPWTRWARSNRHIKQGCPNQRVRRESSD
jgi:hypothetical protein